VVKNFANEKQIELRKNTRTKNPKNASVEFTPGNGSMAYHFRLKDFSSEGFGILVRKDSKVLVNIKPGDVLTMKYHPEIATITPVLHRTKIIHISEPEPGKYQGHMMVGLLILD